MPFVFDTYALVDPDLATAVFGDPDAMPPEQKVMIEHAVNAASAQIERYCDRKFKARVHTEVQDGAVNDEILPRHYPVLAVHSVRFAGGQQFVSALPLEPALYATDGMTISFLYSRTPRGRATVQLIYRAGYESIPMDLQFAAVGQAKYLQSRLPMKGNAPALFGIQSMSKGDESITRDASIGKSGFINDTLGVIDGYRRIEAPYSTMSPRGEL